MTRCGPALYAELILDIPSPGTRTHRSRGNDTTRVFEWFGSTRTTIIVSERCPPFAASLPNCCWSCRLPLVNARVSEPTTKKLTGPPELAAVWTPTRAADDSLASIT